MARTLIVAILSAAVGHLVVLWVRKNEKAMKLIEVTRQFNTDDRNPKSRQDTFGRLSAGSGVTKCKGDSRSSSGCPQR